MESGVLEQRIARIYRIGQKRNIQVINLVASQTIEERMLSTLNFKTSLFEGILDNGEDTIFLEDSKFDKIMDSIKVVADASSEIADDNRADGSNIDWDDKEENINQVADDEKVVKELVESPEEEAIEQARPSVISEQMEEASDSSVSDAEEHPERLVQQGLSFLSGLARTLSSPEATQKLVDSIVEEDKETGQTTLRIPVPDKESVAGILNLFGKLLTGAGK